MIDDEAVILPPIPSRSATIVEGIGLHGMAHGGEAIGRSPDGRAAFVTGGLPGETVEARISATRKQFLRGVLSALPDNPSADRIVPGCAHFGVWPDRGAQPRKWCGGCQWQHADYAAQLGYKHAILRDALIRIGGIAEPDIRPVVGASSPWGYRNTLHVRLIGGRPGLVALSGRDLVQLDTCPIAHPLVAELLEEFESEMPDGTAVSFRAGLNTGDQLVLVEDLDDVIDDVEVGSDASVVLLRANGRLEVAAGRDHYFERIAGRTFEIPSTAFFQVNSEMAEQLVAIVGELLPEKIGTLVDLYGGVGLLGLALCDRAEEVYVVDSDAASIGAATRNAEGLDHVTLIEGDALEGLLYIEAAVDIIIVDPPRTGLTRPLIELIVERAPDTLLYVSCEPATLARDIARFTELGYALDVCAPLDMFPQSFHVESVCRLLRRGDGDRQADLNAGRLEAIAAVLPATVEH